MQDIESVKLDCRECGKSFKSKKSAVYHLFSQQHARQTGQPIKHKCDMCPYLSYDRGNYKAHARRHKAKLTNQINDMLITFRELNINPNDYIDYNKYAKNFDSLTLSELSVFANELAKLIDD